MTSEVGHLRCGNCGSEFSTARSEMRKMLIFQDGLLWKHSDSLAEARRLIRKHRRECGRPEMSPGGPASVLFGQ